MGSLPVTSADKTIRSIAVDPVKPQRVYAAGPAGLFRSDDAGLTWIPAGKGLNGVPLAVTLDPGSPQTVLVVLKDGAVWQSSDGGTSWKTPESRE